MMTIIMIIISYSRVWCDGNDRNFVDDGGGDSGHSPRLTHRNGER